MSQFGRRALVIGSGLAGLAAAAAVAPFGPSSFRVETNIHNSWS